MKTGLILGISVLVAACGGQTGRQAAAGQDTATIAADSGMQVRYYEGTLPTADGTPINYELELKNEEFSGDGSYDLTMIYPKADKGKDKKFRMIGRWGTLRGSAEDPDATVYQLNFGDTTLEQINFLYYPDSLVLLNRHQARLKPGPHYALKQVDALSSAAE